MDLLRDYIIEFNYLYKLYIEGPENYPYLFVLLMNLIFIRAWYFNSWTKSDSIINKTVSKGTRLIMIHAITSFGPLCEKEGNNKPIDD
jgi:hypothetical protein